ncbi:chromate transporter [Rhizobium sp. 007]|nr:chromate transporter [Rhizobium sp. 007]
MEKKGYLTSRTERVTEHTAGFTTRRRTALQLWRWPGKRPGSCFVKSSAEALHEEATRRPNGTPAEVFFAFLKLGLTSFAGPIARLGYFHDELVVRRRWIDEAGYAFFRARLKSGWDRALGLLRDGPLGSFAARVAFTLPSAVLLVVFAMAATAFEGPIGTGLLHGLKMVAVAVVAQAVWGMAKSLTPDRERASIALAAVVIVVFAAGATGQITRT